MYITCNGGWVLRLLAHQRKATTSQQMQCQPSTACATLWSQLYSQLFSRRLKIGSRVISNSVQSFRSSHKICDTGYRASKYPHQRPSHAPAHQNAKCKVVQRPDAFLATAELGVERLVHRCCKDLHKTQFPDELKCVIIHNNYSGTHKLAISWYSST